MLRSTLRRVTSQNLCQGAVSASRKFGGFTSHAEIFGSRYSPVIIAATISAVGISYVNFPSDIAESAAPKIDYESVRKDIANLIEKDSAKREDGTSIGPTFVRLAWHASGTFCKASKSGGSAGATMRFEPEKSWGANAGLGVARDALEEIKMKYPSLTYADLWTLAGSVAIEEMGGPKLKWRPGRIDSEQPTKVPDGRLPDADKGEIRDTIDHIRTIFGRMGFSDTEMVALIGAHAIGRCHTDASGYWGPWTFAETTFSNEYFRLLIEGGPWTVKRTHEGKPWTGPTQFEDPTGKLMMLPSDMAMIWDKQFREISQEFSQSEEKFFKEFSSAWTKLIENGVAFSKPNAGFFSWLMSLFGL
jgi:cytochrome c peroxidase